MPSPDSLKIGLEQANKNQQELEELRKFRAEIINLFQAEKNKALPTAHFSNPSDQTASFNPADLDLPELHLWQGFQVCSLGQRPLELCLTDLADYKKSLNQEGEPPLAKTGLVSYIGNKLTALYGHEELERRRCFLDEVRTFFDENPEN